MSIKQTLLIPVLWGEKEWSKSVTSLKRAFAPGSKNMVLLANTAVQALLHAYEHGDALRCEQLYKAVGESTGAVRGESLKEWFRVMSGQQITAALNKDKVRIWKMVTGWSKDKFTLDLALDKPFWEFMGAETVKPVTGMSLLQSIHAAAKRAKSAHEKGNFKGDFKKVEAVLTTISSFADVQFKKLSAIETGEIDEPTVAAEVAAQVANQGNTTPGPQAEAPTVN